MAFSKRRLDNQINAGSMADIAFLLLIFFLVTTVIENDKGILVNLPRWEIDYIPPRIPPKNVLSVKINKTNELLVEGELTNMDDLKNHTKEFILNPSKRADLPSSPQKAVISIQNDRGTAYATYLEVYNEIRAAYKELWEEAAQRKFQKNYELLDASLKDKIRAEIPLVISEAEPTEHQ